MKQRLVLPQRIVRVLAQWYPRAWRIRYGRELDALLDDFGGSIGWCDVVDVAGALVVAWARRIVGKGRPMDTRTQMSLGRLVGGLLLSALWAAAGIVVTGVVATALMGGWPELHLPLGAHRGLPPFLQFVFITGMVTVMASIPTFALVDQPRDVRRVGWLVIGAELGLASLAIVGSMALGRAGLSQPLVWRRLIFTSTSVQVAFERMTPVSQVVMMYLPVAVGYVLAALQFARMLRRSRGRTEPPPPNGATVTP